MFRALRTPLALITISTCTTFSVAHAAPRSPTTAHYALRGTNSADPDDSYEPQDSEYYEDEDGSQSPPRARKPYPEIEEIDVDAFSEEELIERAKQLFYDAEAYAADGEWEESVVRYAEAYRMLPTKHGFAYKVGYAAYQIRDCALAQQYLEHLVEQGAEEYRLLEKVQDARHLLSEIEVSGCLENSDGEAMAYDSGESAEATPEFDDDPLGESLSYDQSPVTDLPETRKRFDPVAAKRKRLLAGGGVSLSLGIVGVGGGVATLLLANSTAKRLERLSGGGGDPHPHKGDYACRAEDADCPYLMESELQTYNLVTPIALAVGGTALTIGIVLLATAKAKKRGKAEVASVAPFWMPGGGGAQAKLRF